MTPDTPPPPGSDAAIQLGCTCPVLDNGHGKGYLGVDGIYVYSGDCPLHRLKPDEWTTEDEHGRSKHRAGVP